MLFDSHGTGRRSAVVERLMAVAFAGLLVAGCNSTGGFLENVRSISLLEREEAPEAVIVMGYGVIGPSDPEAALADVEITWMQYDPERDRLIASRAQRQKTLLTVSVRPSEENGAGDEENGLYSAHTVTAGCYILHTARARSMSPLTEYLGPTYISQVTLFAGSAETVGRRDHKPVAGSGAPAFCVRGGEVAYIGDYLFDASRRPARLIDHDNSFVEARSFMDEHHPADAAALVTRHITYE